MHCQLLDGAIVFEAPYNQALTQGIKIITGRRAANIVPHTPTSFTPTGTWTLPNGEILITTRFEDNDALKREFGKAARFIWLIPYGALETLRNLVQTHLQEHLTVPALDTSQSITLIYLAKLKLHPGQTERTAYGWGKGWDFIFPERTLFTWFGITPNQRGNLFSLLGLGIGATDAEIKTAWKKAAMTYHPDRNQEPDAEETFKTIKGAYELLKDPAKRQVYLAALALQESIPVEQRPPVDGNEEWKSPVRNGKLRVAGSKVGNRLIIDKIIAWEPITSNGLVAVTWWAPGADQPSLKWVLEEDYV